MSFLEGRWRIQCLDTETVGSTFLSPESAKPDSHINLLPRDLLLRFTITFLDKLKSVAPEVLESHGQLAVVTQVVMPMNLSRGRSDFFKVAPIHM